MTGAVLAGTAQSVRELVLAAPCLTTDDLMDVLAGRPSRASVARMRHQGSLLGVRVAHRGYLYPAFQVDLHRRRVHPDVAKINRALVASRGTSGAIEWWLTASVEEEDVVPAALVTSGRLEDLADVAGSLTRGLQRGSN